MSPSDPTIRIKTSSNLSGSRRKAGTRFLTANSTNKMMNLKQRTLFAGAVAFVIAFVIPSGKLPAWADLGLGATCAICGAIALYGALHWKAND